MLSNKFTINENACVECGQCRRYCPIPNAIIISDQYQHTIIDTLCSGCGLCQAFCPVPSAITRVEIRSPEGLKSLRRIVWRHAGHFILTR